MQTTHFKSQPYSLRVGTNQGLHNTHSSCHPGTAAPVAWSISRRPRQWREGRGPAGAGDRAAQPHQGTACSPTCRLSSEAAGRTKGRANCTCKLRAECRHAQHYLHDSMSRQTVRKRKPACHLKTRSSLFCRHRLTGALRRRPTYGLC